MIDYDEPERYREFPLVHWSAQQDAAHWAVQGGHSANLRFVWLARLMARIGNWWYGHKFKGKATRCDVNPTPPPEGTFRWLPDKYIGRDA